MPVFPSKEWCEEAVRLANADPDAERAGAGWTGDIGLVIGWEPGKLTSDFAVHVEPRGGHIERFTLLRDADELEEIEPAYLVRAQYSVWKELIRGRLDPVEALVRRRLEVVGDVQPLIERMQYRGIADRILAALDTIFVDEQ
ncbi:MAG TPA: SCP2 sterol-binding domain-containing protein [Myxococcaceae bacterium]|nr:SCP2 sterol-binding domain-containing protein [Myxococcaceae bacterium]